MLLLLQVAVVLLASRLVRWLFLVVNQPAVIGEMVAGLVLGPSLFGWLAPSWSAALFPPSSLASLNALSQLGLVLFMFIVGLRTRTESFTLKRGAVAVTSVVNIAAPFALGALAAWIVHERLAPPGVSTLAFVLFIGASMSVTAFPVLARILFDRDMFGTHIGRMAIACAAFGDVVGWMILAAVVTLVHADTGAAIATRVLFLSAYLAVMMGVVRPALRWHAARQASGFGAGVNDLSTVLLVLLLSAVATDALGVHALFGAFFAGVMMPASKTLDEAWIDRVQPITVSLLLPLFFAFTGLRTAVNVLDSATLLRDTVLLLGVAIVGKGVFSAVAARATGMAWRESAMLGALLNTRGLMELVILGIGFDLGILTPVVFSMMVVMTLVTTFMTAPLIDLLRPARRPAEAQEVA